MAVGLSMRACLRPSPFLLSDLLPGTLVGHAPICETAHVHTAHTISAETSYTWSPASMMRAHARVPVTGRGGPASDGMPLHHARITALGGVGVW